MDGRHRDGVSGSALDQDDTVPVDFQHRLLLQLQIRRLRLTHVYGFPVRCGSKVGGKATDVSMVAEYKNRVLLK